MANCPNCNKYFPDYYLHCPFCGRNISNSSPIQNSNYYNNYKANNLNNSIPIGSNPELERAIGMKVLIFGMISLGITVFSLLVSPFIPGLGLFMCIFGLIFAIISLRFSSEFKKTFGGVFDIAKIGKIMGITSLINCGIVLIIILLYALLLYISSWI
ncbi:MAG: hypothetical protein IJH32_00615 [Ruminococcus sp.]|nr:hypothetical protein [Ruminococcus sp.]